MWKKIVRKITWILVKNYAIWMCGLSQINVKWGQILHLHVIKLLFLAWKLWKLISWRSTLTAPLHSFYDLIKKLLFIWPNRRIFFLWVMETKLFDDKEQLVRNIKKLDLWAFKLKKKLCWPGFNICEVDVIVCSGNVQFYFEFNCTFWFEFPVYVHSGWKWISRGQN